MIGYRFVAAAERELDEVAAWYERESEGLGAQFIEELGRTLERARQMPMSGALITDLRTASSEVRRFLLRRFPYKLIAIVDPQQLTIVAVAHDARDPRYWRPRLAKARRR